MDPEIQARIERLYENEALTDNLTDADAKTLLHWAEEQLRAHADESLVAAALSAANTGDATDSAALLAQAQTFLAQQTAAPPISAARPTTPADAAPTQTIPKTLPPTPEASGAVGVEIIPDARVNAKAGGAVKPKKTRRAAKAKSKK